MLFRSLALANGIVEQHHGWIDCSSEPGRGSCFDICLPRFARPLSPRPAPAPISPAQRNRTTTILLADDEPMLRDLGRTILESQGFQVLLAEDGAQALEIFQKERHLIDLVIMDLKMPRLSGHDACRQMLEIDPGVRVLLSSGDPGEDLAAGEDRILGFLQKPYRHHELVQTVHAALEQAGVPQRDVLLMLVKRLEQALNADWAGREPDWVERVLLVLDRVEQVMRQHAQEDLDSPTDTAPPSQTRRLDRLQDRYAEFVKRAGELKSEMQHRARALRLVRAFSTTRSGDRHAGDLPGDLDLDTLRRPVEQFLTDLESHRREEINLVLESVTTDIGGGD